MIDRRRAPGWDGQLQKYLVSVEARDGEDAVGRVLAVLEPRGSFSAFALAAGLND
jgi:acetolactate synthase regulatory subunit